MLRIKSDSLLTVASGLNARALDPDAIYDDYAAAVDDAGAAIYDEQDTRDLIEDLVLSGVYNAALVSFIASGGDKSIGSSGDTIYSVGPGFTGVALSDSIGIFTLRNTADYGWPAYEFPNTAAFLEMAGIVPRKANATSLIIEGANVPIGQVGLFAQFTTGDYNYNGTAGQLETTVNPAGGGAKVWPEGIESRTGANAGGGIYAGYGLDPMAVCSWYWDHEGRSVFTTDDGRNEINRGRQYDGFPPIAVDDTATFTLTQTSTTDAAWRALTILNGRHTLAQQLDFAARRAARL